MPLELTGERTMPGVAHENYWFARHVAAYELALGRCKQARVLDAGCGEGYGTAMLGRVAATVEGVELVPDVVAHARESYPGVVFTEADLCDLPHRPGAFDVAVSFQVIEHLPDVPRYLRETARVLRPGGLFLCATPNRLTFTLGSDHPVNPFHEREFSGRELGETLDDVFDVRAVLGLHHGWRIRTLERAARRSLPELVLARPPGEWPAWLRGVVAAVRPADFVWRADHLDASLDLMAVARRRR